MPQILKEEIKNRIYKAASKIFYEKGFLKTKMKDISEEAKIPVGLVYTYYKNKEELFDEIVNPIYYYLNLAIEKEEKEEGSALERFKATGEEYVLKLLNQHKSLVILMDKAQGTKHENAKQVFIKILENHIKRQVQKKGIIIEEEILIHILASNFTESLLEIARHYENPDWAKKILSLVTKCYYEGVNSILILHALHVECLITK